MANELLEDATTGKLSVISVILPTSAVADDESKGIKIGLGVVAAVVMAMIILFTLIILGVFIAHTYKHRYRVTLGYREVIVH